MPSMSGKVTAMRRDGKGIQMEDGNWYSSFDPISGVTKGDVVEFDYVTKGRFLNIKGRVKVDASSDVSTSDKPTAPANTGARGLSRGKFPIDPLDGQRSIIRQNAVARATELLIASRTPAELKKLSNEEQAEMVISLARQLEAYTAGDLDVKIANERIGAKAEANSVADATTTTNATEL